MTQDALPSGTHGASAPGGAAADDPIVRRALTAACEQRAALLAQPPAAALSVELLHNAARIVPLALACGDREAAARAADVGAAAAAAAVLLARGAGAGEVFTLHVDLREALPEAATLPLPVGPVEVSSADWLQGFALAALARHAGALGILAAPATLAGLEQAGDQAERTAAPAGACAPAADAPAWALPLAPMLAAAARRDAAAARDAGAAPPALADAGAGPRGLWQMARSLAEDAAPAMLAQAATRLQPAMEDDAMRLVAQGLLALALDVSAGAGAGGTAAGVGGGTSASTTAALSPASLPPGVAAYPRHWRAPAWRACYALRSVLNADEARWFLDLAGYPRAVRRHYLARRTLGTPPREQLVACHDMQATAATPSASAEFLLLEPGTDLNAPPVPLALDAGQLLWLAEVFASGAPGQAILEEAEACVRAVLQRLGAAERLDGTQLASPLGRALWQAEPGRFARERLVAYADALAAALAAQRAPAAQPGAAEGVEVAAFRQAMQGAQAIQQVVTPLLQALPRGGADLAAQLRPQPQDYEKVFAGPAAAAAREAYEALWAQPATPFRPPTPEQTSLQVHVAPAGLFGSGVDLVRPFPEGYHAIAPLLDPHRVWVCWKYTRPGAASGLAYDGLVWCDDHWAWFPKPYRMLAAV